MGIGSWPRPRWMLQAMHDWLEGRLDDSAFQATADDAARLCIAAQLRAGVDVVTDGEQRRNSYAGFVGGLLDNCQLIPLSDLTAMVDAPEKFEIELRALDVPAAEVRHPVAYGKLGRSLPLAVHELRFAASCTDRPVKIALPGAIPTNAHDVARLSHRQPVPDPRRVGAGCRPSPARGGALPAGVRRGPRAARRTCPDGGRVRERAGEAQLHVAEP